jgi:hypothetical protein
VTCPECQSALVDCVMKIDEVIYRCGECKFTWKVLVVEVKDDTNKR